MSRRTSFLIALAAFVSFSCGGPAKESSAPSTDPPASPAGCDSAASENPASPTEITTAEVEPTAPECSRDSDCTIFADCCTCKAVPAAEPLPTPCDSVCGESPCDVKRKTIDDVYCDGGRCKLRK